MAFKNCENRILKILYVFLQNPLFPSLSKSSAMWCEADVQSLRLALLPAELSFSKMPKSQKLKMHLTQNSQRKVD